MCDNISREDNGQAVHCSYQKVLLQEKADTQENIKQQTPDKGKRSQVKNTKTEEKIMGRSNIHINMIYGCTFTLSLQYSDRITV